MVTATEFFTGSGVLTRVRLHCDKCNADGPATFTGRSDVEVIRNIVDLNAASCGYHRVIDGERVRHYCRECMGETQCV